MPPSSFQRLLDAGVEFTNLSKQQAEAIVSSLVAAGEVRRRDTETAVQALLDRTRETSARVGEAVQREVARQLGWLSERFDEFEDRFEDFAEQVAARTGVDLPTPAAPRAAAPATGSTARTSTAKKSPAKKSPAKKSPAKKSPAKKTAAKKTAAKKTAAKQTAAKKSPAKKSPAKKSPAKKSPAKK